MQKIIAHLFFFITFLVFAYPDINIRKINRALEKQDYQKVKMLIQKSYEKDPKNPGINYYEAVMFNSSNYLHCNLDSARLAIDESLKNYQSIDEKNEIKLSKYGITKNTIIDLMIIIKEQLYDELIKNYTVKNIEEFRKKYPNSEYENKLIYKRDSIVFGNIKLSNSIEKYKYFINEYHSSVFVQEAKILLDQLRYEALTKETSIASYYHFLEEYPNTRYRSPIEKYILRQSTLMNRKEEFLKFLKFAKTPSLRKLSADILFYLDKNNFDPNIHPSPDSIIQQKKIQRETIFPLSYLNKIGFYSQKIKNWMIQPNYNDIGEQYKCELSNDDWLHVYNNKKGKIIDRLGKTVLKNVSAYTSLDIGFALVNHNKQKYLYHKSGFRVLKTPIKDAKIIDNRWIAVKKGKKWGIISFLGVTLLNFEYDDIYKDEFFYVFKKNQRFALYPEKWLASSLEKNNLSLNFNLDDFERLENQTIIGMRNEQECLLDNQINLLIPWSNHVIYVNKDAIYSKSSNGYKIFDNKSKKLINQNYNHLEFNEHWYALQSDSQWFLLSKNHDAILSKGYDSIKLIASFAALLFKSNQKELLLPNNKRIRIHSQELIKTFVNQQDYFIIKNEEKISLYNNEGKLKINGDFQEISFLNDSLLKVKTQDRYGVMRLDGTYEVEPKYEVISVEKDIIYMLYKNKIAVFDLKTNLKTKPIYKIRPIRLGIFYLTNDNKKHIIYNKKGEYILTLDGYEQVTYWNDTSFLVKKNKYFHFLDIHNHKSSNNIQGITKIISNEKEQIWTYISNNRYGLVSTQRGILIEPSFTNILKMRGYKENEVILLGDRSLYGSKYHVISYIDKKGQYIIAKKYKTGEYKKLLCPNYDESDI